MLVITNRKSCAEKYLFSAGARFVLLDESRATLELKIYLSSAGIPEIKREGLYDCLKGGFKSEFSSFIRGLNRENASLEWWAMNFTSKNYFMSRLYENIFHYICLQEAIAGGRYDDMCLIVITGNYRLARRLKLDKVKDNGAPEISVAPRFTFREILQKTSPVMIVAACVKTLARKILSNAILRRTRSVKEAALIVTQFENTSIGPDGLYHDVYLGDLKGYLLDKGLMPLTAGYVSCNFFRFIFKLNSKKRANKDIYPLEHFMPFLSVARSLGLSLKRYYDPPKTGSIPEMRGYRFDSFIWDEIQNAVSSSQFFINVSAYFSFLALSGAVLPGRLYYPFENRSWEKMLILACRRASPHTVITGYQHTAITPRHMHYLLEPGEYAEIPVPQKIITLGETTRRLLEDWHFPGDILRKGPALRQLSFPSETAVHKRQIRDLLVVLSADISEYVRVLLFLDEAFVSGQAHNVIIRPHPLIPFKKALGIYTPKRLKFSLSQSTLKEDLSACDAVCYASSGASIEAVISGKPVVYLEIDNMLNSDPLFNTDVLKWRCREPGDLTQVLKAIGAMDQNTFTGIQREALKYGRDYFSQAEITNEGRNSLAVFLE